MGSPSGAEHFDVTLPSTSVVICTYSDERVGQVVAAVESLTAQTRLPSEILIVVDHNPDLVAELSSLLGDSVKITANERERGLSGARNTGIDKVEGEIVAFIDDDAWAEPMWLEQLLESFRDDGVIAAGGRILPAWEGGRAPRWLPEEFLWVIGCTYRGMPERGPIRNVIGCNMAFRSDVFRTVGGFSAAVGRLGTQLLGCEETELCIRARQHWPDREIVFVPEAVVHHRVPRSRQKLRYFLDRSFSEGKSKAVVRRLVGTSSLALEGNFIFQTILPGAPLTVTSPSAEAS